MARARRRDEIPASPWRPRLDVLVVGQALRVRRVDRTPELLEAVEHLTTDGDTRWINRGGYDLMDIAPAVESASSGLPRAQALYGPIPQQLNNPDSFASQLQRLLTVNTRVM